MIALLWGLLGALLIGISDCIARVTAQRISSSILFLYIMGLSLIALTIWLLMQGALPPWHPYAWFVSAISGILNLVALYFLYLALARGPVAVASPAASTFAVFLVLTNAAFGEPWNALQMLAVAVVFIGVSQLARHAEGVDIDTQFDSAWLRKTAYFGLAAGLAVTLRMFMAQEASEYVGAINALWLNRFFALAGTIVMIVVLTAKQQTLNWPKGPLLKLVLLQTFLETTALGAFLIGSNVGRIGATIGFAAFSAVTALTAWFWLGERIGARRGIWLAVIAAGVAVASVASP